MATISYDEIYYSEVTGKPLIHHDWIYKEDLKILHHIVDDILIDEFSGDCAYEYFYNLIHDKKTVKKESTKDIHKQTDKRYGHLVSTDNVKKVCKKNSTQTNIFDE